MPARKSSSKTMSEATRLAKNKAIKEKGIATRNRRVNMDCRARDLKIISNRLTSIQKVALKRIFLEAKWIRNAALAAERFDLSYLKELSGSVPVKLQNNDVEQREIRWLGSQMQQSVIVQLTRDLKSLSTLKKNGHKVGKLRFTGRVNSIELQQFNATWRLKNSKVKVQNIPGWLPVRGIQQFSENTEFANAKLVQRADGYHLIVTTFSPKVTAVEPSKSLGIDMGVAHAFSLSDGSKVSGVFEESERLRRLQRKLSRQEKGSNGHTDTKEKIQREYLRLAHRRDELANQLVNSWTRNNLVFFQDEQISSWKRHGSGSRGSRKIHHGVLGRVKARLKSSERAVMLPAWVATTQWCEQCGTRTKHDLSKRVFRCDSCGFAEDRDLHAARNMVTLGRKYKTLTSGTEGSAGGGTVSLKEQLYAVPEHDSLKPETMTSSVSS